VFGGIIPLVGFDAAQIDFSPTCWKSKGTIQVYVISFLLLIISIFQGPSSSGVFGQLGGGWQVWFIGSGQVVDRVGIWLGGQFGVGSRRVLAYLPPSFSGKEA
jgi:hypothetical protein